MEWSDFNKFDDATEGLLPPTGEGETMANQIVTAVSKIVYKWFNDGDVYDTATMTMGFNDLSSYANWLYKYAPCCPRILKEVHDCYDDDDYTHLLYKLCTLTMNMKYLDPFKEKAKIDSIYTCKGPFACHDEDYYDDEEEDDDYWGD